MYSIDLTVPESNWSVDSRLTGDLDGDKAINNEFGSGDRWLSANVGHPHWFKIDFGASNEKTLQKIRFSVEGGRIKGFTFSTVALTREAPPAQLQNQCSKSSVVLRWARLRVVAGNHASSRPAPSVARAERQRTPRSRRSFACRPIV